MANPILVEVTRGDLVESIHCGAIAIADASGALKLALGDVTAPVYSRSSLKPMQAIPLVESGAADAFGLGDEEIALACASHSGEPMHTERVEAWLARIGLTQSDLACGAHPSRYEPVVEAMIRARLKPTRIFNNCSGKHTGFLTVARHWDVATAGYEHADHPVQKAVAAALRDLTGASALPYGIDGCAAPNFATSLTQFATAAARMATPGALPAPRAAATARIIGAMIKHPELMSGTGRACATLIRACGGKASVKTGAEGFFGAWIPSRGLGVAIKIDDGAGRASETAMAAVLDQLGLLNDDPKARAILRAPVINTRGATVGERRPSAVLAALAIA
ncbi:MAG: asparaginase [Alphaproteobacteria bacterium]|nr:asparaginase [Alphaproteobacteria bacterium]MBL6939758.1 asparaginase [Alphaproteobacteria bacterium]MBL7096920.1 asparaginase [Alphaproteobacteria bacterium]